MNRIICLTVVLFSLALIPLHAQDEVVPDTVKTVDAPDSLGMSAPLYAPFVRPYGLWGGIYSCLPTFYGAGPDSWKLHEGFNVQFSLSVTAGLGSHAPRGVGFGQDAAFMYAQPLTKRLSVAGGVYMSHMDWGGFTYNQVGVAGVAAFQVNEKVSLYAYGSKALLPQKVPPYWSPYVGGDRFGGMLHVKFNDTFSMGFSVERRSYPDDWFDSSCLP